MFAKLIVFGWKHQKISEKFGQNRQEIWGKRLSIISSHREKQFFPKFLNDFAEACFQPYLRKINISYFWTNKCRIWLNMYFKYYFLIIRDKNNVDYCSLKSSNFYSFSLDFTDWIYLAIANQKCLQTLKWDRYLFLICSHW